VVAGLPAAAWVAPTAAEGWDVRDHVAHLAFFDEAATLAVVDAQRLADEVRLALAGPAAYEARWLSRGRALTVPALLAWWRRARAALLEAAAGLPREARLPWYGPPMSAATFLTARLMETWAHGEDIVDGVGGRGENTDRLRHIATLGVLTRPFSYRIRGQAPPADPVRVALVLPSSAVWTAGDEQASNRITGRARDFCLVVTQRRHVDDTGLSVRGPVAAAWMRLAQAFAGPPGPGRPAGWGPGSPGSGRARPGRVVGPRSPVDGVDL
jgi:uncharacterized protein (TIGR03084 family)